MTKKAPRPLDLQFDIAIQWLQHNEGDIEEHTACKVVAEWLAEQQLEGMIRAVAKDKGVTPATIRKAMKAIEKRKQSNEQQ